MTADIEGDVDNARMRQICLLHAADVTRLLQSLVAQGALEQVGQGRWSRYRIARPGHSLHKGIDSLHNADLLAAAAPARSQQRLMPKEMERIILRLCMNRWLTRNEIANLLDRNSESIRQRFLNPMVAHGLLSLRYPDKPNRVDQAYSTAEQPRCDGVQLTINMDD